MLELAGLTSGASYGAALLALAEAARKVAVKISRHRVGRDFMAVGLALLAVAVVAGAPLTMTWSQHSLGAAGFAMAAHDLALLGFVGCVAAVLRLIEASRLRIRTAFRLIAATATVLLVLLAGAGMTAALGTRGRTTHIWLLHMHQTMYVLVMGAAASCVGYLLWRHVRGMAATCPADRAVRTGVYLCVAAAATADVSLVGTWTLNLRTMTDVAPGVPYSVVVPLLSTVAALLWVSGSVWSSVRQWWQRTTSGTTSHQRRAVRRLWILLEPVRERYALTPTPTLPPGVAARAPRIEDQGWQILDACQRLQAHVPAGLRLEVAAFGIGRGLSEHQIEVLVAAVELLTGTRALLMGRRAGDQNADPVVDDDDAYIGFDGSAELDFAWLTGLHHAIEHDEDVCVLVDRAGIQLGALPLDTAA